MDSSFGILSILPPLIAIGLAIWKKQLIPSIFLGILFGETILAKGNVASAFISTLDDMLKIISDKVNLQIILFSLLAGGLLNLIKESNGFHGFLNWCRKKNVFKKEKNIYPLTYFLNIFLFIDSWSSILITGSIMRDIYTKFGVSRERLAYFLHTISINFVALVIINSWGAFYLSILRAQNVENPLGIVIRAIPFNFFCVGSLVLVIIVMMTRLTIGPMKKFEYEAREGNQHHEKTADTDLDISMERKGIKPEAKHLILPVLTLIFFVFLGLFITGKGSIIRGSGSASLFNAACITIGLTAVHLLIKKLLNIQEIINSVFKGMADLLPIGMLLVLSLTIGYVCKQLETGIYLSEVVKQSLPVFVVPAIVFGISCITSFATGTSWGTMAIMIPIAMPIAVIMQINPALIFGACLGGGVFGDNCSPISDTSILTGMVAEVDVINHVKTQIPYTLIAASIAIVFYLIAGAFL